jgi:hypothetical protein
MQHYVIKFFNATGRWFSPVTPIEILLKVAPDIYVFITYIVNISYDLYNFLTFAS